MKEVVLVDPDKDGLHYLYDLCTGTAAADLVDANGCSDLQVDQDSDGYCNPGAPSDGPSACIGTDNCPAEANPLQIQTSTMKSECAALTLKRTVTLLEKNTS